MQQTDGSCWETPRHSHAAVQMFPLCVTHVAPGAVVLAALYLVQSGVREIKFFGTVVDGKAVRGSDVVADDHEDVGASQRGTHDTGRLLIPVGPKH